MEFCDPSFRVALQEFKDHTQIQSELARQFATKARGKTEKRKCEHSFTINSEGWEICVTCGLYLRKDSVFLEMRNIIVIEQWFGKKFRRIDWRK